MNHSPSFHCDLGSLAYGALPKGDFRPFRTAEEMTSFTGLTVQAWLDRQKAEAASRKAHCKAKQPDISEYV